LIPCHWAKSNPNLHRQEYPGNCRVELQCLLRETMTEWNNKGWGYSGTALYIVLLLLFDASFVTGGNQEARGDKENRATGI